MKAIVKEKIGFGISILDVPKPYIQADEVLVKVAFAGICGSDQHIYEWSEGYNWLKLPLILGHEFSGVVVETGSKVKSVKVGGPVTVSPHIYCGKCYYCKHGKPNFCQEGALKIGFTRPGAFAEFVAVPENSVFILPEDYPLDVAALTEPFCVAQHAIDIAGDSLGNSILIVGPGPICLILMQLLKHAGMPQILVAGLSKDGNRLKLAKELGADQTVVVDMQDLVRVVQNATGGIGVDTVFEISGSTKALTEATKVVKKGGKIFMVGIFQKSREFFFTPLVRNELVLHGVFNYTPETWRKVVSSYSTRKLVLDSLITHRIRIEEIEKGFRLLKQKKAIKILIIP